MLELFGAGAPVAKVNFCNTACSLECGLSVQPSEVPGIEVLSLETLLTDTFVEMFDNETTIVSVLDWFDESDGSQKSVKFVLSGAAYDVDTESITFDASTYGDDFPESIGQARRSLNAERYSEAFRVVGRTALAAVEQEPGTATARAVGEGISAVSRATVSVVPRSVVDAPASVALVAPEASSSSLERNFGQTTSVICSGDTQSIFGQQNAVHSTFTFSEEQGESDYQNGRPMAGIRCSASRCDNKNIRWYSGSARWDNSLMNREEPAYWTPWARDIPNWSGTDPLINPARNQAIACAGPNQYVTKMQCRGSHCRDMRVFCESNALIELSTDIDDAYWWIECLPGWVITGDDWK